MNGINKVIILGNLGSDPVLRYTPAGVAVTTISIATSKAWKDKNTNQNVEKVEWHRVVLYKRLAEIASEYLKKGSKVYIEGSLRTQKWEDSNKNERYSTDIIAREMQMLDSSSSKNDSKSSSDGYNDDMPHEEEFHGDIPFTA